MSDAGITNHSASSEQFLTFSIVDRLYALPAVEIIEVIPLPVMARVPHAPIGLMGLANLRGAVVPIASARTLLGQTEESSRNGRRALVLEGASPSALAVDFVGGLVRIPTTDIDSAFREIGAYQGEELQGAFRNATGEPVRILNLKSLLQRAFSLRTRIARPGGSVKPASQTVRVAGAKLVTFDVAGQEYALALDSVDEIINAPNELTALPRSEPVLLGVTSLRESLLPLLSLRGLLGFGLVEYSGKEKVLVSRIEGSLVGLVADRMQTIVTVDDGKMEAVPELLAARMAGESKVQSIYRQENGRLISVLKTEALFGEEVMRKLRSAPTTPLKVESKASNASQTLQFVVFQLGEEEFGLPIDVVEEVARIPSSITRVPNAPRFLEGVINLRGDVLPIVDQRRRFDMPATSGSASRRLIVVKTSEHLAGLIVDGVSEVVRVEEQSVEATPDLTGEATQLVNGVINLHAAGRIILLLDPAELLTRAERDLLNSFVQSDSDSGQSTQ